MRLLCIAALLVLTVAALAEDKSSDNKMLLGADNVDEKHAEMVEAEADSKEPPKGIKEVKKQVKDDKRALKELQDRARALKEQLRDSKQLSKDAKKVLKKEFRTAKHDLEAKKLEISSLKNEMKELKGKTPPSLSTNSGRRGGKAKHRDGGRRKKNKHELIGAEEAKLNNPEQLGLQSEPVVEDVGISKKEQRKLMKKMSKKKGRKHDRKNKKHGNEISDGGQEMPKLRSSFLDIPRRAKKQHRKNKGRVSCTTDADCLNGGICFTNRHGHKFCKGNGLDKTAGKKCHRSEQCARGLQCFVTNKRSEKKHKTPKGICADPFTADLTKGSFIPFKTSTN